MKLAFWRKEQPVQEVEPIRQQTSAHKRMPPAPLDYRMKAYPYLYMRSGLVGSPTFDYYSQYTLPSKCKHCGAPAITEICRYCRCRIW